MSGGASGGVSGADGHTDSAAFCTNLVRGHDFVRYASSLFVPADRRRALLALYAFNVEISRVRDQVSQPLQRRLPVEPLSRLIEEHQFDLYNDPMPTLAALEGYVTDTSSALFMLAARIAGPPSAEVEHLARHAGLAQGFAEVIAALPRDASRRQLFLPLQLLESHGSGMEEVFAGQQMPRTRAALDQLIGEARQHLDTAMTLLADVAPDQSARGHRSVRAACEIAAFDFVDAVAGLAIGYVSWRMIR